MNNYYDEWQQVPYDRKSPNYRGDLLPEWKKQEIRESIAKAKAIDHPVGHFENATMDQLVKAFDFYKYGIHGVLFSLSRNLFFKTSRSFSY